MVVETYSTNWISEGDQIPLTQIASRLSRPSDMITYEGLIMYDESVCGVCLMTTRTNSDTRYLYKWRLQTVGRGFKELSLVLAMEELSNLKLELKIEGDVLDLHSIHADKIDNGYQSHQLQKLLKDLQLSQDIVHNKPIPFKINGILKQNEIFNQDKGVPDSVNYHPWLVKISHDGRSIYMNLVNTVDHYISLTEKHKMIHTQTVKWLEHYLKIIKSFEYVMKSGITKRLERHKDTDWTGNWDSLIPENDSDTTTSRYGSTVKVANDLFYHNSRLVTLSSTEAENITSYEVVREVSSLIDIIQELKEREFYLLKKNTEAKCKVFEDNSGPIEIANGDKYQPKTMHIKAKYYNMRELLQKGIMVPPHPVTFKRLAKHDSSLIHWDLMPAVSEGVLEYMDHHTMVHHTKKKMTIPCCPFYVALRTTLGGSQSQWMVTVNYTR